MGFVSSFFQKLPLKSVAQLPLQTLDFMLQKLLFTHMVFILQRRKIRSRFFLLRFISSVKEFFNLKELNFFAELASAIGKHSIVCFICYYEIDYQGQKEGIYNIGKAYTTEKLVHIPMAITTTETNEKILDLYATILQSATKNEFFSPSTKKLLDNIVESSATAKKVPPPVTIAKRTLVFRTVPSEIGLNFTEANTSTSLPTNAHASPLKKQRDDEL